MATRSQSTACPPSPLDQGELGPSILAATDEPTSLEPKVYGEVSLSRAISLLLGLQNQVLRLERELEEQKEATKEARDWMGAVDQTLACVEARGGTPHTPEDRKPLAVEATPRPLPKTDPFPAPSAPLIAWANPTKPPITFAQPTPVRAPPRPAAPVATYQAPVKVDHPDAYTGKIGNESQQWLTRMMAWVRLNQRMFPTDQEVLLFLLMNMKDTAGAWAHPHLDQLGSHRAIIQTVEDFRREFLAAFGNPDATRAAERQITHLTQTGTCAEYITKFRTIAMDLDWNDAALRGQFARGLHWEVSRLIATQERRPTTLLELQNAALVIDNALRKERASHPPKGSKSGTSSTPNRGTSTGQQATRPGRLSSNPNFVPRRNKTAAGLKASASNAVRWAINLRNAARAGKPHPRRKVSKRKPPRLAKSLDLNREKTKEIDWNQRTLSFPHAPPEHVAIAKEEEADKNPLEGVPPEYHQYAKVFGEEEFNKLPPHRHYNIGIELTKEGPLNSPLYSMTDAESATLKDWLRDELKAGKIRPSKSSISSPVMFVPKKDGSRCLVVDYRRLNNRTKKNVYPLPRPDDLMAQLRGAKIFTKLDLRWGYNNVQVKEGDKWKTAFRTKYGLYESLVMTFGLTNAPAAFQHFMNELFKDLLDVCVIIYLDDILIYSKDDASHTQHVHEVLRRLMKNQLFCKASKCTFHVTSVEYLGIIVSDKGFSLDKLKIQAVQEWLVPTKAATQSSQEGHSLEMDIKEQEAFQGLKDAITNAPVLCHADPSKPYFLETDALGAALGSILSQRQEDGRLHPLGFLSESFKGAEQNYDTHDKELLAIIRSFEYWRIFLEGTVHPVTVFTDHRNLEYWKESWMFNRRHARWHLLLAGYNFQIVYRPGKQSGKPDALSRRSDHANIPPEPQTMLLDPIFANVALITPKKELQRQIEASLDQDESLEEILQFLQNESKAPPSIKQAFKDYQMEAGLLFYQGRIVVPDTGTLRTDLLRIFHDSPLAGHPGRQRTLELVSRNYYWPGIRADTYWHVDSCETCQRIRKPKYASIPPQPLELPSRPWQHISYNMIVDLPKDGAYNSILVIVDSFTKYVILVECSKKLKAPELADLFLQHVWKKYGMPEKTISNQGRVFNNKFLKALYKRLGIDPHFSSAYHPQSNGQTERVNPTVKHFLRAYSGVNQKDWVKWLPMAEFAYNNAVHNVPTDVPKADDIASQMESQWREIEAALRQSKTRMTAGETGEPISFEEGEEAWLDARNVKLKTLSPKLTEQRLGPFKIIEKISDRAYRLELPPSMRIHNVFYVGLLSKVKRDDKRAFENRPPPVTVDGEEEYKVEGITDMENRNGKWFFRVKWKGYGSEENTWEPRENLKNAKKILKKFEKEMKEKALGAAKALKGGQCRRHTRYQGIYSHFLKFKRRQTDNIFDHVTSALISYKSAKPRPHPRLSQHT
ncbi:hypothetical protein RHS01_01184 [Rhizoctonia solani]|uniref:Reverse transcriptase n=1 Tax=Rhizoctonia solani TaxID=456999 RepID=A0A8H7IJH1_9AGAM|nr:hypothetical protein RHS01_01184 [Rhizoctonia solani]